MECAVLILELFRVTIDTICSVTPGPATGLRNGDTAPTIYSPFHCYCSSLSEESWNLDCSINWIYVSQTKICWLLTQCSVLLYQGHGFLTFLLCSLFNNVSAEILFGKASFELDFFFFLLRILFNLVCFNLSCMCYNQGPNSSLVICIHETFSRMHNV